MGGCRAPSAPQLPSKVEPSPAIPKPSAAATVLFFVDAECPISNRYAPEVNRIVADYTPRNAAFFLVHVDPDRDDRTLERHANEYGYAIPVLHDADHTLVRRAGVTVTPEVAVMRPDGTIAYRGRIDDRFPGLGQRRHGEARPDLRLALDAVLAGQQVEVPVTTPVGCTIAPLQSEER